LLSFTAAPVWAQQGGGPQGAMRYRAVRPELIRLTIPVFLAIPRLPETDMLSFEGRRAIGP
jgi:hypothetical protein